MNSASPVSPAPDILADLLTNGGGTYERGTLTAFRPTSGYAVGIGGVEMTLPEFEALGPEGRAMLLRQIADEFETNYVGTWLRQSDYTVYIDSVAYFSEFDGQSAWRLAIAENQQEVFDFGAGRSIRPGQITFDQ